MPRAHSSDCRNRVVFTHSRADSGRHPSSLTELLTSGKGRVGLPPKGPCSVQWPSWCQGQSWPRLEIQTARPRCARPGLHCQPAHPHLWHARPALAAAMAASAGASAKRQAADGDCCHRTAAAPQACTHSGGGRAAASDGVRAARAASRASCPPEGASTGARPSSTCGLAPAGPCHGCQLRAHSPLHTSSQSQSHP